MDISIIRYYATTTQITASQQLTEGMYSAPVLLFKLIAATLSAVCVVWFLFYYTKQAYKGKK